MYRNLLFEQSFDVQLQAFYNTALGELYQAIPFEELSKQIPKPRRAISGKGCKPWFDVKGGIALQLLKSYYRTHTGADMQHSFVRLGICAYKITLHN